jgi:hypothetical protein
VKSDGRTYVSELIRTRTALQRLVRGATGQYVGVMRKALESGRVGDITMLSSRDGALGGYAAGDLTVQVLGPVPEQVNRKWMLRRLGNDGVTKNGHSVVLKLRYKQVTFGLGGDLNAQSQRHLLERHAGIADLDDLDHGGDEAARAAALERARAAFRVDVAKSCHHGSSDVEDFFLEATDAIATVISSGDNESYAHPRPDMLGATGRYGRGRRPLIFSTELARSPSSALERPQQFRRAAGGTIDDARAAVNTTGTTLEEEPGKTVHQYQRAIAVYGLITVRTDGERVLVAQKLESPSGARQFDYHCLEPVDGELVYNPDR